MPTRPRAHAPPAIRGDRLSASRRGYDAAWRRLRALILARKPVCQVCGREEATDVDHTDSLISGGARLDESNCTPMCKSCHSKKTCRVDGGFGRAVERRG